MKFFLKENAKHFYEIRFQRKNVERKLYGKYKDIFEFEG